MKTGDTRAWVSQRTAMLIGGFGLLLMAILAPIAQFGVLQGLIVDGNAETTAHNIAASQESFVFAVVALLLVAVLDVVVALALYVVFAPTNRLLSGLAAVLRIVYGAMFVLAILHLVSVASMAGGAKADPTSVIPPWMRSSPDGTPPWWSSACTCWCSASWSSRPARAAGSPGSSSSCRPSAT